MVRGLAKKKARFLEAVSRGMTITAAANYAVVDRSMPYKWEQQDPIFREAWQREIHDALHQLTDRAQELAMEGNVQLLKFLIHRLDAQTVLDSATAVGKTTQAELVIINPPPSITPATVTEEHRHEHHGSFISISKS